MHRWLIVRLDCPLGELSKSHAWLPAINADPAMLALGGLAALNLHDSIPPAAQGCCWLAAGPLPAQLRGALQAAHLTHRPHLGCMNTANVLRAMPAALPRAGACTTWGVALKTPPVRTCSQCSESEGHIALRDRVQQRLCTCPHAASVHSAVQLLPQLHQALMVDLRPRSYSDGCSKARPPHDSHSLRHGADRSPERSPPSGRPSGLEGC